VSLLGLGGLGFPTFNDTTWASLAICCPFETRADAWWLAWMDEWKEELIFWLVAGLVAMMMVSFACEAGYGRF
jgi:hypothetical protein